MNLTFIRPEEIKKIRESSAGQTDLCEIMGDIFRLNAVSMVKKATSGHLGSTLSSMDILTWLWFFEMKDPNTDDGDIFFSSKGHDVPALYSVLIGAGRLDFDFSYKLRRLYGLPGHPDIHTPGVMTNTGSLGMGISKARGMALANRLNNKQREIFVLCGDGELQEGQIWESLRQTANHKFSEITVIIDRNKIQSDTWTRKVNDYGGLKEKFLAFGWDVAECNGHNFEELKNVFEYFKTVPDKPHVLIADTIKGKGVSYMEGTAFDPNGDFYKYHSGAPTDEEYDKAVKELLGRINGKLSEPIIIEESELPPEKQKDPDRQNVVIAYGDELLKVSEENKDIVVLDADLVKDHSIYEFKKQFPERFFECGIAEQDMVSMAGGLALQKKLPVVHSFASFLSARANEQIYNNATEGTKIIYIGSLAGIIPATPGHSHQCVRDISALGSVPGLVMIQPANEQESRLAIRWAAQENKNSTYIRFFNIFFRPLFALPDSYKLIEGRGVKVRQGSDAAIVSYGPTMLNQAVKTAELLKQENISAAVINLPWLNKIDEEWLMRELENFKLVITLDDHYVEFGQGTLVASILAKNCFRGKIINSGISEIPACGGADEVLEFHKFDPQSLSRIIKGGLNS